MASSSSSVSDFFVDDDEETLVLLLARSDALDARLPALGERFLDDSSGRDKSKLWTTLADSARSSGLAVDYTVRDTSPAVPSIGSLPKALESDDGKNHLQAVQSILGVSQRQAVELTLSAMRTIAVTSTAADKKDPFPSLLGTRALLEKVLEYAHKQRTARLSVIAELLRAEQGDSEASDAVVTLLDSLDETCQDGLKQNRGLFRTLLVTACQPDILLNRNVSVPAQKLRISATSRSFGDFPDSWKKFIRDVMDQTRAFAQRERLVALEALLVLLYHRVQGGVSRSDLAIILLAFQTRGFFANDLADGGTSRLSHLAGLICVESMALWRVFESADAPDWIKSHPIFRDLIDGGLAADAAEGELGAISSLLRRYTSQIPDRYRKTGTAEAPEALALLAFGLLLHDGYAVSLQTGSPGSVAEMWKALGARGLEMAEAANNEHDVFSYFHTVMDDMVVIPAPRAGKRSELLLPSDVLSLCDDKALESEEKAEHELSAPCLAYASIGRELLNAAIHSFQDKILPAGRLPLPANIIMLTNLVEVTFRNSPTLCELFWADWDAYNSSLEKAAPSPLVRLMNSALGLATSALDSNQKMSDDDVLRSVTPLIQVVASLASSSDIVEAVMLAELPQGLIRYALFILLSSSSLSSESEDFVQCRRKLLQSICTLARIGDSLSCRKVLRLALEENDAPAVAGPRTLMHIVHASRDGETTTLVLTLLAELLDSSPLEWILDVVRGLKSLQDSDEVWCSLFARKNSTTQEIVRVIDGLLSEMPKIVFSSLIDENAVVLILSVLKHAVLSTGMILSSSLSTTSRYLSDENRVTSGLASSILDCLTSALEQVQTVIELHKSRKVKQSAVGFLENLINALAARGLGEAIFSCATAPVALSMACVIDSALQDRKVLHIMMDSDETTAPYGSIYASGHPVSDNEVTRIVPLLIKELDSPDSTTFDYEGIQARRWLSNEEDAEDPLRASLSALRLLNWWAKSLDMIFPDVNHLDIGGTRQSVNDRMTELIGLSPFHLLVASAVLPPDVGRDTALHSVWMAAAVSNFSLFLNYVKKGQAGTINAALSAQTLDFLLVSFSHVQRSLATWNGAAQASFFRNVWESTAFRQSIESHIQGLPSLLRKESFTLPEKFELSLGLRCLRIIASCIDTGPLLAAKFLDENSVVVLLAEEVKNFLSQFENTKNDGKANLLSNSSLLWKLRIGGGSLSVICSVWRQRLLSIASAESKVLETAASSVTDLAPYLASFVFKHSDMLSVVGEEECGRSVFVKAIALALDLLSMEISWVYENERITSELPVVRALETALEQNLSSFIAKSKDFVTVKGFVPYTRAYNDFSSQVVGQLSIDPSGIFRLLRMLRNPTAQFGWDSSCDFSGFDTGARRWLESFGNDLFTQLTFSSEFLSSELHCLASWSAFSQILALLLKKWRKDSPTAAMLSMPEGVFSSSTTRVVLHAFRENWTSLEEADTALISEGSEMSVILAGLLLSMILAGESFNVSSADDWVDSMKSISDISKKVLRIVMAKPLDGFLSMKQLLASATVLSKYCHPEETLPNELKSQCDEIFLELISTTCTVIRTLEQPASVGKEYASCFRTSVSFLAASLGCVRSYSLSHRLCQVLKEFDVLRSLVWQARNPPSTDDLAPGSSMLYASEPRDDSRGHVYLLSVLGLFSSAASDPNMLALLASSDASNILGSSCSFASSNFQFRGYTATGNGKSISTMFGEEDPAHKVWMASLKFVGACLCASNNYPVDSNTRRFFLRTAIDFLSVNKDAVLQSLRLCSTVSFSTSDKDQLFLTLNILRECHQILWVSSELCAREAQSMFKRDCPELLSALVNQALGLVVSLSSFLGASGASRDIFRALTNWETADVMDVDFGGDVAALGPVYRLVAGGLQNAKHEAIRYSHFVLSCSRPITQEDYDAQKMFPVRWKREIGDQTHFGSPSLSSLEKTCREAVTSQFSYQLEMEAAIALNFAMSILWKVHPASTSFVMYSQEEAARLDAMRLVKPGAIIAFREAGSRFFHRLIRVEDGEVHQDPLLYARVLDCDSVRRQWHCQLIDSHQGDSVGCIVDESQLAGIEDPSKRVCMLSCIAAPESMSELEAAGKAASVGHLILALRWCSEFFSEIRDDDRREEREAVCRLAELATSFLGTELSIHREISQQISLRPDSLKALPDQLLDLFGEASEFYDDGVSSVPVGAPRREGRIKHVVSDLSWEGMRDQVQGELGEAIISLAEKRGGVKRHVGRGLFIRRNSSSFTA